MSFRRPKGGRISVASTLCSRDSSLTLWRVVEGLPEKWQNVLVNLLPLNWRRTTKGLEKSLHKFHRCVSAWFIMSPCETWGLQQDSPSFTSAECETWWTLVNAWSFTYRYWKSESYILLKLVKAVLQPCFIHWIGSAWCRRLERHTPCLPHPSFRLPSRQLPSHTWCSRRTWWLRHG